MMATKTSAPIQCDYCGYVGQFPTEVEIRGDKFACVNTVECDERWAADNPPDAGSDDE